MRSGSKERWRVRRVPPADLGPMLAAARERAGLNQRQASAITGMASNYLNGLERGRRTPSLAAAKRLSAVLQLTVEEEHRLYAVAVPDAGYSHPARRAAA